MDSPVGGALRAVRTSNGWTTLTAVLKKVNAVLVRAGEPPVDARTLVSFFAAVGEDELRQHGVWVHSFGPRFQPIVATNPAYARARQEDPASLECSCGLAAAASGDGAGAGAGDGEGDGARYFRSHAYNGGRHASTASAHRAACALWTPPSSGHLHSWRRGYE